MHNNHFSNWKCLCAKEALAREQHASTKKAIIDDCCAADKPLAELGEAVNNLYAALRGGPKLRAPKYSTGFTTATPLVTSFLTEEQVMYYLVTGKIK